MTIWEFAIARKFGMLLKTSANRDLTTAERQLLDSLAPLVDQYERREIQTPASAEGDGMAGVRSVETPSVMGHNISSISQGGNRG